MRICKLVRRNCANYKPLLYKYLFSSVQLLVYSVLSHHEFHAISITAISELLQCYLRYLFVYFLLPLGLLAFINSSVITDPIAHINRAIGRKSMKRTNFHVLHFSSFIGFVSVYELH